MKQKIDAVLEERPNLKAKDIAKVLGFSRKDVSAFLHSNKKDYRQNDKYEWSLYSPQKVTMSLHSGWMTADQFEDVFKEVGSVLEMDCKEVEIIFPNGCKPMIDALARILALANQIAKQGKLVSADFTNCKSTFTYLDRSGFLDMLDLRVKVFPERPGESAAGRYRGNSDNLEEFGEIDPFSENDELKERLASKFISLTSAEYTQAAYTVFSELIGNVYEHSDSGMYGFSGLQKYGGMRNHIQTVISDSGIGIAETLRSTLREYHQDLYERFKKKTQENDAGLVEEAMGKGKISRYGSENGLGFHSSRKQATKFRAEYTVRQNRFSLRFEFREERLFKVHRQLGLPLLEGTHICFDFFLD